MTDVTPAAALAASTSSLAMRIAGFDAWERSLPLDGNVSFALWGARRVEDGLADQPASDWFVDRLGPFLDPVGICKDEVEGATGLPMQAAAGLFRQVADAQEKVRARPRNFTLRNPKASVDDVRQCLPAELQDLRETPLDPDNGDEYPGMDGKVRARLLGMHTDRMRVLAAVVVAVHRSFHPFARLGQLLKALERLEDVFEAAGESIDDPKGAARVLDAYYVHRTLLPQDATFTREVVVDVLFAIRPLLLAYASIRPQHGQAVEAILPPLPSRDCEFERQHCRISRAAKAASADSRKLLSDPLADRLDPILSACRVRRNQVRRMELRCRKIEALMLARDPDTGGWLHGPTLDFCYRDRVVTPSGRRLVATQRLYMRAHRESALPGGRDDATIVFAYLRAEADGLRSHDPWFVEMFATGALLKPTRVAVERRDRRRDTIIRLDLPDLHDKPAGLAGVDGHREANVCGKALAKDIVVIPVRALSHAMTLAYLMVRVMAYSFCRIGEALQMTYHARDPEHWRTIHVPERNRLYQAFLAIPKGWEDADEFLVDDVTARLIATLARMTKAREKGGRLLACAGSHDLADNKKDGEKLYVFAFRGRPITTSDMNYMFRILTAGFGKLRSHDIRHAAANCADEEKVEMKTIKLLLRHRSESDRDARRYARKTPTQIARAKAAFLRDAEARDALGQDETEEEHAYA